MPGVFKNSNLFGKVWQMVLDINRDLVYASEVHRWYEDMSLLYE